MLPGQCIVADQPGHLATVIEQIRGRHIVDQHGPLRRRTAGQRQRQPGVVELTIPILDATHQLMRLGRRQQGQGFGSTEYFGTPQAGFAGQNVVQLEPASVKRNLPPPVGRHDKRQRLRQMRRVFQQRCALMQGLAHQTNIALGQIAHAAMNQFGRT